MRTPTGIANASPMAGAEIGVLMESSSDASLCERAVLAIWKSLDAHDLVDEAVRERLAQVLEPLGSLPLEGRPQRLVKTLRLPDPIDPSKLYWLTRRLLTLVPELQALAHPSAPLGVVPQAPPHWN